MSKNVDTERAVDADASRSARTIKTCEQIIVIKKLQQQGLSQTAIAERLGWTRQTLRNWLLALRFIERRGIKMSKRSTHP